jgi:hypothetical protein
LKDLFFREGYQYDFVFDWTILNYQSKSESATSPSAAPGGNGGGEVAVA